MPPLNRRNKMTTKQIIDAIQDTELKCFYGLISQKECNTIISKLEFQFLSTDN